MTTTILGLLKLRRITPIDKHELIAWEVVDIKGKYRYGIIVKQYNKYFTRFMGWREYKDTFWVFYSTSPGVYLIGSTRLEALKPILDRIAPVVKS